MTADDLPLVRHWLGEAHVVKWWGAPDQQFDLVKGDLDEPAMHQFIVAPATLGHSVICSATIPHPGTIVLRTAARGHARHRSVHRRS